MNRRDALSKAGFLAAGAFTSLGASAETGVRKTAPKEPPSAAPLPYEAGPTSFSVRDFKAIGDGLADDAPALQRALDHLIDLGGGRLHFPAGRYRLSQGLKITAPVRLDITGDGLSSLLCCEADEATLTWTEQAPCRYSSVRDLCFCAVGKEKTPSTPAILCQAGTEHGTIFEHLYIQGEGIAPGSGIVIKKVVDTTTFNHCFMWGISGVGIEAAQGSELRIFGGRIIGSYTGGEGGGVGIRLTGNNGGVHVVTTDLIMLDTGMVAGEKGGQVNREIFITHATFDSSRVGLHVLNAAYVSLTGVWAASSDEAQMILESEQSPLAPGGAMVVIAGGSIANAGAYKRGGANHGLILRGGSLTMNGVNFWHNKGTALWVDEKGPSNCLVSACRFNNNGLAARLSKAPHLFANNMLVENTINIESDDESWKSQGNLII